MNIPWRLKSAAFRVIDIVGDAPLYFAQKYVTRRAAPRGLEVSQNWLFHQRVIREKGATKVLEFGAGKDLVQNLFLSQDRDLHQVTVDLFDMLDLGLVNLAIENLEVAGVPMAGPVRTRNEIKDKYRIEFIAPLDLTDAPFSDASFDACISTNTLEHIPVSVIQGIWRECARILRPGGVVSAKIDYSDHYAHTDRSISPLNYLRFTEAQWARFNHRSHFQNRLRHQHHLGLLEEHGFEIENEEAMDYADQPAAQSTALTGSQSDYAQTGFVVARRR